MINKSYCEDVIIAPISISEPHQPVVVIVDCSKSMCGYENAIRTAIKYMSKHVSTNKIAGECVEICVVLFNSDVEVAQVFTAAKNSMVDIDINANGCTNLPEALKTALNEVDKRRDYYKRLGISCQVPYLILLSDIMSNVGNMDEVIDEIHERESDEKLKLWTLAIGNYNQRLIKKLTGGERVFEVKKDEEFDEGLFDFFHFMSEAVIRSSNRRPGQKMTEEEINTPIGTTSPCHLANFREVV